MRKYWLLLLSLLTIPTVVLAAAYTVNTTASQDLIIGRARAEWNSKNLPGSPFATDTAFVDYQCKQRLQDVANQLKAADKEGLCEYWATATNAQKNNICTTIGRPSTTTDPCQLCQ